jgi:hypothetical protein
MKIRFITLLIPFLMLFALSCQKEPKEVKESMITFKVNGEEKTYRSKEAIRFIFAGLQITTPGKEKPNDVLDIKAPGIFIRVKDHATPISSGAYFGKTYYANGFTKEVYISYQHETEGDFLPDYVNPDTYAEIEEISREGVKGSFRATLKHQGKPDIVITEGRFEIYTYGG